MAMTAVNIPQEHNLTSVILLYLVLSALLKILRTPISKQRNKHIQHVLVKATAESENSG